MIYPVATAFNNPEDIMSSMPDTAEERFPKKV
jgi:hypothetical protein